VHDKFLGNPCLISLRDRPWLGIYNSSVFPVKQWIVQNLVLLCRSHHRLIHEGGYGVHVSPEQHLHFTMPDGTELPAGPDGRSRGNVIAIEATNRKNGLDITPNTAITRWNGDKMDLSMAVDALIQRE